MVLSGTEVSDNDDNNIPHYSQLKGCLTKIQNNFPLLQKLLNEREHENKNKFVIDSEIVEVEDKVEDDIKKILNIFSELWNLNTLGPGSALILLHCMRKRVEEGTRLCLKSNNDKIDRSKNENRNKNENDEVSSSTSNTETIENFDIIEKRVNRDEVIAAAVHALLDTVESIPTTRHPRLFFIISWLLTTPNAEHSSEHSSAVTEDPFLAPQFMSKNVRKDCSVMDLFVSNSAIDDGNNRTANEYFNVNLPILPGVFEWLDSRVNDILTVRSSDILDSDALLSKGRALTSLIAMVTHQLRFLSFSCSCRYVSHAFPFLQHGFLFSSFLPLVLFLPSSRTPSLLFYPSLSHISPSFTLTLSLIMYFFIHSHTFSIFPSLTLTLSLSLVLLL